MKKEINYSELKITKMPEPGLKDFWEALEKAAYTERVFYEIKNMDWGAFVDFAERYRRSLYFVRIKGKVAGFYWLSHFEETAARIHFCAFPGRERYFLPGGRYILDDLFNYYRVLWAYIPSENYPAVRFTERLGFKFFGGILDYYEDGDSVKILYLKRSKHEKGIFPK